MGGWVIVRERELLAQGILADRLAIDGPYRGNVAVGAKLLAHIGNWPRWGKAVFIRPSPAPRESGRGREFSPPGGRA